MIWRIESEVVRPNQHRPEHFRIMKTERLVTALVMIGGSTTLLTSCVERPVAYVPTSQTSPATVNELEACATRV